MSPGCRWKFYTADGRPDAVRPPGLQGSGYELFLPQASRVISCSFSPRKIGFLRWILKGFIRIKKEAGHLAGHIRNNSHAVLNPSGRGKIPKARRNRGAGYGPVSLLEPFHQSFRPAPRRFTAPPRVVAAVAAAQGQCGSGKAAAHVLTETQSGAEGRGCPDDLCRDVQEAILLQTEEDRFRSSPASPVTLRRILPCFFHPLRLQRMIFRHLSLPGQSSSRGRRDLYHPDRAKPEVFL
jgi:hypothetical protein